MTKVHKITGVFLAILMLGWLSPHPADAAPAGVDYAAAHYASSTDNSPVSWDNIQHDFQVMAKHYDIVRTYSMDLWNSLRVLRAAKRYGLKMAVGVGWAYGYDAQNQTQLDLFKYVFGTYPELQEVVDYVIAGNEACIAGEKDAWKEWLDFRDTIQKWVNNNWEHTKPTVTISERDVVWEATTTAQCGGYLKSNLPDKLPIFANVYPFWADITVDEAVKGSNAESLSHKWERLQSAVTGRDIIMGETGWPTGGTAGTNPKTVKPSETDAATYWKYVYDTFVKDNPKTILFAFEAFDEPLKPSEGGSPDLAHHWGVYGTLRGVKKDMTFPKDLRVDLKPSTGAYINIVVMAGGVYDAAKKRITISTPDRTYSYDQWFANQAETAGYPWGYYNQVVTLNLPAVTGYPAARCSNTLTGGHGIGQPGDMNLQWQGTRDVSPPCNQISWADNGIWLP